MTNKELRALRQILALTVKEAAEHIGGVTSRQWERYENGISPVPPDVRNTIWDFAQIRDQLVEKRYAEFQAAGDHLILDYYLTLDDFEAATGKRNVVMWRITNSVAVECYSAGFAQLI